MNILRCCSNVDEFPLILGREFCGVVKERGEKVRDDIQTGDKVWGVIPSNMTGSQAEYIVVDQSTVSKSCKESQVAIHTICTFSSR